MLRLGAHIRHKGREKRINRAQNAESHRRSQKGGWILHKDFKNITDGNGEEIQWDGKTCRNSSDDKRIPFKAGKFGKNGFSQKKVNSGPNNQSHEGSGDFPCNFGSNQDHGNRSHSDSQDRKAANPFMEPDGGKNPIRIKKHFHAQDRRNLAQKNNHRNAVHEPCDDRIGDEFYERSTA